MDRVGSTYLAQPDPIHLSLLRPRLPLFGGDVRRGNKKERKKRGEEGKRFLLSISFSI